MKLIRILLVLILLIIFCCENNAERIPSLPDKILSIKDNSQMILVPGGPFIYGISKAKRNKLLKELENAQSSIFEYEFPEQRKFISAYYIDKYEITNEQYETFVKSTGHKRSRYSSWRLYNRPKQPVVGIGWADAEKYAKWAGKRLPTEEEWEKAARGTDGRIWPWGNEPSGEKYNGISQGNYAPVEVGTYPAGASPYGLMDMAGNVYEMTTGIWGGAGKAMRGGSFLNTAAYTRTMFRWATRKEATGAEYLGFRCVMDITAISKYATYKGNQ